MWAKYKPIEHPSTGTLTLEQRKGSADQQADGIFYGVKINGNVSQKIDTNLAQVHNVTFEYVRPTGWKRLYDFDGYAHHAVPKPYAYLPTEECYFNDEDLNNRGISGIQCNYMNGDTSGIDFTDRLVSVAGSDTLAKAFPSIVITKSDGTYFTALNYSQDDSYRPLYNGFNYADGTWYCNMSKKVMNGVDEMSSPFTSEEEVTASIILIKSASATAPLLNVFGQNFGTHWIKADGSFASAAIPMVVPGALGQTISLKEYFSGIIFEPVSVSALKIAGYAVSFSVPITEVTGKDSTNKITITVQITLNGGGTYSYEFTRNGWTAGSSITSPSIKTDLIHVNGKTYSGRVSVSTTDGTATSIRTDTFTNI
jgi:hypothetical protein